MPLDFILNTLIFLLSSSILFLGIGYQLISKIKASLSILEKTSVSVVVGIAVFTFTTFVSQSLFHSNLLLILVFLEGVFGIVKFFKEINLRRFDLKLIIVVILGVVATSSITFFSGLKYKEGIRFFGANTDGVWHLSIINSLIKQFPPQNPVQAGTPLKNYHYLMDLLITEFSKISSISPLDLYFRFFPVLISTLLGISIYILVKRLTENQIAAYIAVFLVYFGGSFGYIPAIINKLESPQESIFWSSQSISLLVNLQLAFSFVFLLTVLLLLHLFEKKPSGTLILLISLISGVTLGFKIYGGLLLIAGLFVLTLHKVIIKKQLKYLGVFGLSSLIGLIVSPIKNVSGSFLILQPGWFIQTMYVTGDHLNNVDWELKRQTYIAESNWKRVAQLWLEGFTIFIIGNFGTRFLAILYLPKLFVKTVKGNSVLLVMSVISVVGVIIPLLFLQSGVAWNSIQFIYYPLLMFDVFIAVWISNLKNKKLFIAVVIFLILLSIPTSIDTLNRYYKGYRDQSSFAVSNNKLNALDYIKQKVGDNVVLIQPNELSYISALSEHPTYYDTHWINQFILSGSSERLKNTNDFFCNKWSLSESEKFLSDNGIKYIFIEKDKSCYPNNVRSLQKAKLVLSNSEVDLFLVGD